MQYLNFNQFFFQNFVVWDQYREELFKRSMKT